MKFDTIIIGGGLSGLTAGIALQKKGIRTAIISSGQSAVHFSSGSFSLLSHVNGEAVANPLEAMKSLPAEHPYSRIGADKCAELAKSVPAFMAEAGLSYTGSADCNAWRLTPIGLFKPSWLHSVETAVAPGPDPKAWGKTVICRLKGFLDFYPGFLEDNLKKAGADVHTAVITTEHLDTMRRNNTEMRAPNIARIMRGAELHAFARAIKEAAGDAKTVIIPAVIGLDSEKPVEELRAMLPGILLMAIATNPASVPGMRTQMMLRRHFENLGGTYFLGDNVTDGTVKDNRLESVRTANLGDDRMEAKTYILATGSFFSRGVVAAPDRIFEPVLGLDVDAPADRNAWFDKNLFAEQPYMSYGVHTDADARVSIAGKVLENVYAIGAVTGGCNALKDGCGAGVAILSALNVANKIS